MTTAQNIERIRSYIEQGQKSGDSHMLGFEIEHFVVREGRLVPYLSEDDKPGVEDLLASLRSFYDGEVTTTDINGAIHCIGLNREFAPLTIEPGAQLEISIGPCESIAQIEKFYARFRNEIDPILENMGCQLVTVGYHPSACACEIPLISKHRYHMMDKWFKTSGKHGICMMRGSASTQISIDYDDEADCMRKMYVATCLSPLFYFLCDNSPVFEGCKVGAAGGTASKSPVSQLPIPKRMVRCHIWDDVDPTRSKAARCLFEQNPSYRSYAEQIYGAPPILTMDTPGVDSTATWRGQKTAQQIYANTAMRPGDIEHLLSMFFFDVRLKQYIEIRQPDSMPIEYGMSFAALVKGLFYHSQNLQRLWDEFHNAKVDPEQIYTAEERLTHKGYEANVYGRPAYEWYDQLFEMAKEGLDAQAQRDGINDADYLQPLAQLANLRTTLIESRACGE